MGFQLNRELQCCFISSTIEFKSILNVAKSSAKRRDNGLITACKRNQRRSPEKSDKDDQFIWKNLEKCGLIYMFKAIKSFESINLLFSRINLTRRTKCNFRVEVKSCLNKTTSLDKWLSEQCLDESILLQ
ncbi:hypothetical protein BpHYR1_048216 [Brachionus plicatilis]|uniref:Uncharacterized protein n=1 Tax=Brachionus plicatilis TaxID=10195 RepID=A0A3M7RY73_BRAPC|nr:hypothetical protein BpHYR1_048216 [Brachionus plicatilis]